MTAIRRTLRPFAHALRSVLGTNGLADRLASLEASVLSQHQSRTVAEPAAREPTARPATPGPTTPAGPERVCGTLADLEALNQQLADRPMAERVDKAGRFLLTPGELPLAAAGDPFGDAYHAKAVETWRVISGRESYDSRRDELAPYLDPKTALLRPAFYSSGDSRYVGEFLSGIGFILDRLAVKAGDSVLEYGAGEGQIALMLARTGCEVAVIDVEQRYLDGIALQARAIGAEIALQQGVFGDAFEDGRTFDRILFFEAFHHALEHRAVLRRLLPMLKPAGYVVLAGEPVIRPGSFWDPVVPYPWGPRLDGLSVNAMRMHGWCELGFREDYFVEAALRAGYLPEFHACSATAAGSCYVLRPHRGRLEMGQPFLISVCGDDAGWHQPESGMRWTGAHARLPLDTEGARAGVTVTFYNFLPIERSVEVRLGGRAQSLQFAPGEERTVHLEVPPDAIHLEIITRPERIGAHTATEDSRMAGIAVRSVLYPAAGA